MSQQTNHIERSTNTCGKRCKRHNELCTGKHVSGPDIHSHKQERSVFACVWKA